MLKCLVFCLAVTADHSLEGIYACHGKESGSHYAAVVTIRQPVIEETGKKADIYLVTWLTPTEIYTGVGFKDGDRFNVSWRRDKGIGVTSYKIGRELSGRWSSNPGNGAVNYETLRFLHKLPAVPAKREL